MHTTPKRGYSVLPGIPHCRGFPTLWVEPMPPKVITDWTSQASQPDLWVTYPREQSIAMEPCLEGEFELRDLRSDGPPEG
eukprot:5489022-Ditylum_brightwellii.AAC.1